MSSKKLARSVLLLMMVLCLGITGLWASGSSAQSGTALTIWLLSNKQIPLDTLVPEYQKANPGVQIQPSFYDTDGIKDACKVAASSRTLPDMWFNWGGTLGGFYADNGLTYDLTSYARTNGWDRIFSPGVISLCTFNGKLSGYPTSYNVMSFYYRKDIFTRFNLSVPTTFDEFEAVCATLKANGITPISTAGRYGWHVMRFLELLIEHYTGAELHDQMNTFKVSYDNDAVVRALTKFKEFVDKGYFPAGFITADPNDTQVEVFSGRAAMDVQGQWYDGVILREGQDMNLYGSFAFPSGGANRLSAFAEMTQINANTNAERLEAIIKFQDFMYSNSAADRFSENYNLPLPRLDSAMPRGMPNVEALYGFANKNGTFTVTDQAFPTEVCDELFRVQDGLANNQVTPQQGATRIQAAIEAYLKR